MGYDTYTEINATHIGGWREEGNKLVEERWRLVSGEKNQRILCLLK